MQDFPKPDDAASVNSSNFGISRRRAPFEGQSAYKEQFHKYEVDNAPRRIPGQLRSERPNVKFEGESTYKQVRLDKLSISISQTSLQQLKKNVQCCVSRRFRESPLRARSTSTTALRSKFGSDIHQTQTNFRLRRDLLMNSAQHSVATSVTKITVRSDCLRPTGIFVERWFGLYYSLRR